MRVSEAMEFAFLKFWVPSFFVLNKIERGATLFCNFFGIYRLRSDFIPTLKQILKYELFSFKRLYFQFLYKDAWLSFCPNVKINLANYQCVRREIF